MSKNPIQWAEQSREFVGEVQVEFKKVTWPARREIVAGSIAVIVVTTILSLALFGVDSVLALIVDRILR